MRQYAATLDSVVASWQIVGQMFSEFPARLAVLIEQGLSPLPFRITAGVVPCRTPKRPALFAWLRGLLGEGNSGPHGDDIPRMFAPPCRCWSAVPLTLRYPTKGDHRGLRRFHSSPVLRIGFVIPQNGGRDWVGLQLQTGERVPILAGLRPSTIDSRHASDAFKTMCILFRPNFFGRSLGRKIGVLYDDYVNNVSGSACAINKREEEVVLHTQEVRGSSPCAPTIRVNKLRYALLTSYVWRRRSENLRPVESVV